MKQPTVILVRLAFIIIVFMSCKTDHINRVDRTDEENATADTTAHRLLIKVGSNTFSGTLTTNAAASAFKARLPLTIHMEELNGNEKLYRFSANLPGNPSNPGTIQTGDLMLYTSNTLVLFYKTFSTSYAYTRIGKVNDVSGLAAALGSGDVTVSFALE